MSTRDRRRAPASRRAPTRSLREGWPDGPVQITSGTAELVTSPDDPDAVTLMVNDVPSSHLDLADPLRLEFEYMQQMAAVLDAMPARDASFRLTHLGAAGCSMARWAHARYPGARQIAVDLDATLLELVRTWFGLPRSPALRLRAGDARAELATLATDSADVVIRDVFAGNCTPEHVTTQEFTADVHRVLRPGGVYLANCADRPPLSLARDEMATLAPVFAQVGLIAEPSVLRGRRYGNVLLVGTDDPTLLDQANLARALRSLPVPARLLTHAEASAFARAGSPRHDPMAPPDPSDPETPSQLEQPGS